MKPRGFLPVWGEKTPNLEDSFSICRAKFCGDTGDGVLAKQHFLVGNIGLCMPN